LPVSCYWCGTKTFLIKYIAGPSFPGKFLPAKGKDKQPLASFFVGEIPRDHPHHSFHQLIGAAKCALTLRFLFYLPLPSPLGSRLYEIFTSKGSMAMILSVIRLFLRLEGAVFCLADSWPPDGSDSPREGKRKKFWSCPLVWLFKIIYFPSPQILFLFWRGDLVENGRKNGKKAAAKKTVARWNAPKKELPGQ